MSTLHPISGQHIYLGGALSDKNSDFVEADFSSQTWVEIDGWKNAGKLGDTATLIGTDLINRRRKLKQKGTRDGGSMQNQFVLVDNDPGQAALAVAQATDDSYAIRIVNNNAASAISLTGVSMTAASPGVATKTAHGLVVNTPVKFTAGAGTLPTGIVDGTTYYVKTVPTADTFTVSATKGGTVINTTGTPAGTYTVTTVPAPSERLFIALVMNTAGMGGEANTIDGLDVTLEVNSNVVAVARNPLV